MRSTFRVLNCFWIDSVTKDYYRLDARFVQAVKLHPWFLQQRVEVWKTTSPSVLCGFLYVVDHENIHKTLG
jgi:hypothetical protein